MSLDFPLPRSSRQTDDLVAAAGQTQFLYGFPILDPEDLAVETKAPAALAWTPLTSGVDFVVTGAGSTTGGTFVLTAPAAGGDLYRAFGRRLPRRETSVVTNGQVIASALERDLDAQIISAQEQRRDIDAVGDRLGEVDAATGLAIAARNLAQEWAEKPIGEEITGYPGSRSARHHALAAAADRALVESLVGVLLDAGDQEDPPGATFDHGEQT